MKSILQFLLIMLLFACSSDPNPLDIQGHRGCRGLMPENSIPAFEHALKLGVTTLEMDAVISKDKQVVVSHEPFMSQEICLTPDGQAIGEEDQRSHNLYQLTYEEIKAYDCGSKPHTRFPQQKKIAVHKPLLKEVIEHAETLQRKTNRPPVFYNIETKSKPEGDNIFHPEPKEFVDLLVSIFKETGIFKRTTLQSFDVRTLQYAHQAYPDLQLVLLIENEQSVAENLKTLGFVPDVYSPDFHLVDAHAMQTCKDQGMKLIPWTVNSPTDIQRMLDLGVDGIISDYPDRLLEIVGK